MRNNNPTQKYLANDGFWQILPNYQTYNLPSIRPVRSGLVLAFLRGFSALFE
jgi:hypothetical protein